MWQHTFLLQVRVANDRTTVRMKIKNVKYALKLWAFRAFEKNLRLSNSGGTIFFEELKHKFSLNGFYFVCEIPPHPTHRDSQIPDKLLVKKRYHVRMI